MDGQPVIEYGEGVYLTQKDIRQLQLAKGAVRTGIDMILKKGE
nr:ATP-binding protein [Desulfobacula sp.]